MPLRIPDEPKILTKVYDSFRGVDLTNDSTNVWSKRSPDGYNMLPDEAGRPFKRFGYKIEVSGDDFISTYSQDRGEYTGDFSILRCYYFELGGINHIVIFTNIGLFMYTVSDFASGALEFIDDDPDLIDSKERAFFFEGGGTSAFYIYGNYRVWRYSVDGFEELKPHITDPNPINIDLDDEFSTSDGIYIPTIRIGTGSGGDGTIHQSVNLMCAYVSEDFGDSSGLASVQLVMPVDETEADKCIVLVSDTLPYDTKLTVTDSGTAPTASTAQLTTASGVSTIAFDHTYQKLVDGDDFIKVIYPRASIISDDKSEQSATVETATA